MSHPAARLVAGLVVFLLVGWVVGELGSRLHTGVHYPRDVAASVPIGIGSGVLATRLPRWVRQRRVERRRVEVVR